ncbi:MAG: flagellar biosynthetic protein FliR [Candidatus Eremiobacteraeota bacterium]|nr:flagellar biosynthetic protein FliR [Candidatus Eremiobacteraeota bacterium]
MNSFDGTALLVFARAAGLVARAPGFSHPSVPPVARAGFAFALAFGVAPFVAPVRALELGAFTFALAGDFVVGAAIGFGASLLYDGAYFAGRTVDDYLGVRGSVPGANVASAQAFGRLWSYAFLAAFVLLDGWVPVVRAFADSFAHVAAGSFVAGDAWMRFAIAFPATILRAAFLVAAPAIAVAASLQLALAAVARVVPRFSSFTLAFPVVFAAALIVTLVTVPLLAPLGARPWLVLPWETAR